MRVVVHGRLILHRSAVTGEVEFLNEDPDILCGSGGSEDISDRLFLIANGADPLVAGFLLMFHLRERQRDRDNDSGIITY